jgi:hypothetical protein
MAIAVCDSFPVGNISWRWLLRQLTYRESLRDIEVSLAAHRQKLYHSGFRSLVKRSTLADANDNRDWNIYADFAQSLIQIARPLYADTDLGLDLTATVYALDATTIDLSPVAVSLGAVSLWSRWRETSYDDRYSRCDSCFY